jgi:hypothetical protein
MCIIYTYFLKAFKTRYDKILNVSREKYSRSKGLVEEKINKTIDDLDKQEKAWEKKKEEFKNKEKEKKEEKRQNLSRKQI